MKSLKALTVIVAGGLSLNAFADCEQPPLVMIPAQEEDVSGKEQEIAEATQDYFEQMREYVQCIQEELNAAGENPPAFYRSILVQRNNAAVAEAEAVQRWFNIRFQGAATVELPPAAD